MNSGSGAMKTGQSEDAKQREVNNKVREIQASKGSAEEKGQRLSNYMWDLMYGTAGVGSILGMKYLERAYNRLFTEVIGQIGERILSDIIMTRFPKMKFTTADIEAITGDMGTWVQKRIESGNFSWQELEQKIGAWTKDPYFKLSMGDRDVIKGLFFEEAGTKKLGADAMKIGLVDSGESMLDAALRYQLRSRQWGMLREWGGDLRDFLVKMGKAAGTTVADFVKGNWKVVAEAWEEDGLKGVAKTRQGQLAILLIAVFGTKYLVDRYYGGKQARPGMPNSGDLDGKETAKTVDTLKDSAPKEEKDLRTEGEKDLEKLKKDAPSLAAYIKNVSKRRDDLDLRYLVATAYKVYNGGGMANLKGNWKGIEDAYRKTYK